MNMKIGNRDALQGNPETQSQSWGKNNDFDEKHKIGEWRKEKRVVRNLDVGQSSTQETKGIKRWNFVWNNVGGGSDEGS